MRDGCRRRPTGCRSAASNGPTASPRSRAGSCRATSTTTRASSRRSAASFCESALGARRLTGVTSVAVIGLGRVGLPLALSFADRGLDVIGVERVPATLEAVEAGRMPFHETGTQEVLDRVRESGRLRVTPHVQDAADADHIVLTLGTPAHIHVEIDVSQIRHVIDDLLPVLREGHSVVLRSTVAPGTTEWVAGYVEQRRGFTVGEDLFVSHVPERIAENHFLEEIASLPCIVGGVGETSGAKAAELFEVFGTEIVQTSPVEAELAKIWTNILRYAQFALPNLLMMECEQFG